MKDDSSRITTLEPREEPTAQQLIDELTESITAASAMGVFERLQRCHNVQHCLWKNQQPDGRLGEDDKDLPVFRWRGAPDLRVPLADKIVRWLTLLRMSVFNRGSTQIGPRRVEAGQDATGVAAIWQNVMDYFACVQEWGWAKAFELFSTCVGEFGYSILLGDWEEKHREGKIPVELQRISDALLLQEQDRFVREALESLPEGEEPPELEQLMTPEAEEEISRRVAEELETLLASANDPSESDLALVMSLDPKMTDSEAKRVLRELAKNPTEPAHYYARQEDGGLPVAQAFVPWVNCLHSHDLEVARPGQCDWFAIPRFYSETRLREKALVEGWDKQLTNDLIENHKNKFWSEICTGLEVPGWAMMGTGIGCEPDLTAMEKVPRWLVVHIWRRVTTKTGLPMVCKGVLSPHLKGGLLLWETTDLRELPIVVETNEPCIYAMMSRGVPDVIVDKQNAVKDTLDGEAARGQLGSNPPLLRTGAQNVGLRPGIEMYAKRSGQSYDGTRFLEVPPVDQGALKVAEKLELLVEQYYFRSTDTSEEDAQMFRESVIFSSKRCMVLLFRVLWEQVQEKIDRVQVSRVGGRTVSLEVDRDQIAGEADISIGVHLDGYNKDAAEKFVKVLGQLMQNDRSGAIDWTEATNIATQLLAPTYARRLIMTSEQASAKVVDDQEGRIAKMAAGVPVRYEERVTNPGLRLQVLQQWAQMPGNVERAQNDPLFADMLQKEQDMLSFQQQQQTINPVIGRTGVAPNQPAEAA